MPKVLLIDDYITQLHYSRNGVREAGFSLASASTGATALALFHSLGASGSIFLRELHEVSQNVPVIVTRAAWLKLNMRA